MRTSSDVINENFPQTVADILRNSELPGPLEALERYKILTWPWFLHNSDKDLLVSSQTMTMRDTSNLKVKISRPLID